MRKLKILSIFITVVFLSAMHFCAVEEAFTFSHHSAGTQQVRSNSAGGMLDLIDFSPDRLPRAVFLLPHSSHTPPLF